MRNPVGRLLSNIILMSGYVPASKVLHRYFSNKGNSHAGLEESYWSCAIERS
jgi:hypothetical protein